MTTGGLDVGNLLGLVIVGTVATKMVDNMGNNNRRDEQEEEEEPRKKKHTHQSQTVAHKRVSHSSRSLLQPRTDGDTPF